MNETWANGTQAGEAQGTEAQWAEAEADGTLDGDTLVDGDEKDGQDVEDLRRVRLRGFLRELVRQEGRLEAAELLGVAYRTLVKAEESGELTGRVSDALERLLSTGDDPEVVRLRERAGALEERMEALEGGVKELQGTLDPLDAAVGGEAARQAEGQDTAAAAEAGGEDLARAQGDEGAGRSATEAAPPVAGLRPKKPFTERRLDPEVVTEEPAAEDAEVYGAAWPLVEEWRRLRAGHPHQGRSLSWLGDRGAAARAGAGHAGGARADAAPGDPASAGLRAQGADQLAQDGGSTTRGRRCESGSCCGGCGAYAPSDSGGNSRTESAAGFWPARRCHAGTKRSRKWMGDTERRNRNEPE